MIVTLLAPSFEKGGLGRILYEIPLNPPFSKGEATHP